MKSLNRPSSERNQEPLSTETFLTIGHVPSTCVSFVLTQQNLPETM